MPARSVAFLLLLAPSLVQAQSDREIALGIYEELRELAREEELDSELAVELLEATELLIRIRSDQVDPLEAYETALLAAEAADAGEEGSRLLRYASLLRSRGLLERLIEVVTPRLSPLWEGDSNQAFLFNLELMLVQVLRETQRWDEAMSRLDSLTTKIEAAPDPSLYLSFAHGERAGIYLAYGLVDLAALWQERQREVLTRSPNAIRQADLLEANLLLGREDYSRLVERVSEMLTDTRLYPEGGLQRGRLLVRAGLAHNVLARKDEAHLARGQRLLANAVEYPLEPFEERRAHLALGENALLQGRLEEAGDFVTRALDDRGSAPPADIAAIGATLLGRITRTMAVESDSPLQLEASLRALERAYDRFLDSWAKLPLRPGGFGFFEYNDNVRIVSELICSRLALRSDQEGREDAVEYVLRAQGLHSLVRSLTEPLSGQAREDEEIVSLEAVRRALLPPQHAALIYVPALDRSHLFAITHDDVMHFELASIFELREVIRPLVRRYVGPPPTEAEHRTAFLDARKRSLEANSRALLPEGARAMLEGIKHLTIVGTDMVPLVPFEELPLDGGDRLGNRLATGYLSSLPAAVSLLHRRNEERQRTKTANSAGVWVMANPSPHRDLPGNWRSLPLDAEGALEWVSSISHHGVELLYGDEARPSALKSQSLREASVLQIISHGAADLEQERPAMLLLHGETVEQSLLRCSEVESLRVPELVCLSACATSKGPRREGDGGASNFEGAFLEAGASSVVLSPYDIEFHSTRFVMTAFHDELSRGRSPSEALQRAYLELRQEPRYSGPAPLSLIRVTGLAHLPLLDPPVEPSAKGPPLAVLAAAVVVLGLLGVLFRAARTRS